ncbi:unnamed protein product [Microthlaspi erraticum]|uniref:RRM domain-containing protein n=1 Tax=Microthlaspi erraticum TaxID=1685480 RepID=A0A6D2JX93_9BRAS|nr:unnamed protein product [Microthlaspi erraticum]
MADKNYQIADVGEISEALCISDRLFLVNLELTTTESDVRGFLTDNGIQATKLEFDTEIDMHNEQKKICNVTLASPDQMGKAMMYLNGSSMKNHSVVYTHRHLKRFLTAEVTGFEETTTEAMKKVIETTLGKYGVLSVYISPQKSTAHVVLCGNEDEDTPSGVDEDKDGDEVVPSGVDEDGVDSCDESTLGAGENLRRFALFKCKIRKEGKVQVGSLCIEEVRNMLKKFVEEGGFDLAAAVKRDGRDFNE